MSLFSNDMRVANTAAPSFTSEANVGQFGWTGADQGHYNQLIQYVDECRKIWLNLEEKIFFIEDLLSTVSNIDAQVKYVERMTLSVENSVIETRTFRDQTASMYTEIKPLIDDFFPKYEDGVQKYAEVIILHSEAKQAAIDAAQSEIGSKDWYDKSKDLYDDLKEGQVYRGTWDPTSNVYPDHQGTNSVWDVILPIGTLEHNFGGFLWRSGDRLLYVVSASAYQQLATGSGVASINGKVGAVTLSAADVGAPAVRPDKRIVIENITHGDPIGLLKSQEGVSWLVQGDDAVPQHVAVGVSTTEGPVFYDGSETPKIFHEKFLPTANQVGAFPNTGGTVDGAVYTQGGCIVRSPNKGHWIGMEATDVESPYISAMNSSATRKALEFSSIGATNHGTLTSTGDIFVGGSKVYHQGFKPTADDVKALSVTGGELSGGLLVNANDPAPLTLRRASQVGIKFEAGANSQYLGVSNSGDLRYGVNADHGSNFLVYHSGSKPTATDIGAVSNTGTNTVPRYGVNFTSNNDVWISANFQKESEEGTVVIGALGGGGVIGAHNKRMSEWSKLHVNTYAGDNSSQSAKPPTIISRPHELYTTAVGGVIERPLAARTVHVENPSWFLSESVVRFMDLGVLARAVTRGASSEWSTINVNAFRFYIRVRVSAPSASVYSQTYSFTIDGVAATNSSDAWEYPHNFTAHAQHHRKGTIRHQLVPAGENGGAPYWELHMPTGMNLRDAADRSVVLEICAMNIWE